MESSQTPLSYFITVLLHGIIPDPLELFNISIAARNL